MADVARIIDEVQKGRSMPHGVSRHLRENSDPRIVKLLQWAGFSDVKQLESRKILYGAMRIACFYDFKPSSDERS